MDLQKENCLNSLIAFHSKMSSLADEDKQWLYVLSCITWSTASTHKVVISSPY